MSGNAALAVPGEPTIRYVGPGRGGGRPLVLLPGPVGEQHELGTLAIEPPRSHYLDTLEGFLQHQPVTA